jgi:hypothetical protein
LEKSNSAFVVINPQLDNNVGINLVEKIKILEIQKELK